MGWFFKPKVQLGLLVNFAFVMFTLVSSSAGGRTQRVILDVRRSLDAAESSAPAARTANETFRYVPLPPRLGASQAASYYDKQTRQTNVRTTHELTLVSKDGRTLTLAPSFYVNGNTIVPPHEVLLTFYSTAPTRFYADECVLDAKADERTGFWAILPVARKRTSKGVVESMEESIPYSIFVKLATSNRVTITIGSEKITLTDEHLSALRDMQRCIQDGTCS
ncbi:MAG TPA: hypothetical protein VGP08_05580 [Pyrinomonadaceae bacterium]|jgi:hypothetical protein|nr:hypothetical protein [Pyrinomonadaceae bacterium]